MLFGSGIKIQRLVAGPSLAYARGDSSGVSLYFLRGSRGFLFQILRILLSRTACKRQQQQNCENMGMSEEVLDKIFIPFFSTKKHGSGIGLSLCKQIMMLHRGNIQVQSVEGEGTAFSLQF